MPVVLRIGPYRLSFYSHEGNEPPHVHVRRERFAAKFWIDPVVEMADNKGYARHELNTIHRLVQRHQAVLLEAWHEHLG